MPSSLQQRRWLRRYDIWRVNEVEMPMKSLCFKLAGKMCCLELEAVREILGYMEFTPITAPEQSLIGQFDLRGRTTAVLDLRTRLNLAATRTDLTSMIIVEHNGNGWALIVDEVISLENLAFGSVMLAPEAGISENFAAGVSRLHETPVICLALAKVLDVLPLQRAA